MDTVLYCDHPKCRKEITDSPVLYVEKTAKIYHNERDHLLSLASEAYTVGLTVIPISREIALGLAAGEMLYQSKKGTFLINDDGSETPI